MLSTVFSHATLGNSLVAIVAGIVAQSAADAFGYVAPFDVAIIVLVTMTVILIYTWPENYGDSKAAIHESFVEAWNTIRSDYNVLYLGMIQGLFEGAMYTFVLEWTPALSNAVGEGQTIPHGYIFASFMIAIMIGSSFFRMLTRAFRPESFLRFVLALAAICLATPIFFPTDVVVIFGSFVVFEVCVGVFWPAMGYLRGKYIPEHARSTTMNFFRIPLNLIVILILWQNFPMTVIFQFCVAFLIIAAFVQHAMAGRTLTHPANERALPVKTPIIIADEETQQS